MGGISDDGLGSVDLAILLAVSEELSDEDKLLADAEPDVTDDFEDDDLDDSDESMPERDDDIF